MAFAGLRSMIQGGAAGLGKQAPQRMGYAKKLKTTDFMSADLSVVASKWQVIGTNTVLAQRGMRFGSGDGSQPYNQGYLYVYIKNTGSTEQKGKVRLTLSTNDERTKYSVFEDEAELLHGDVNDIAKKVPLSLQAPPQFRGDGMAREDDKLLIEFYPDAAGVVGNDETIINLPVTEYA